MSPYNPNSVWESKEKKYEYTAPNDAVPKPQRSVPPPLKPPTGSNGSVNGGEPSFFRRHGILLFSVGLIALAALAGFVVYLLLPAGSPNVSISFSKPDQVQVGTPIVFTVVLSNYSNTILKNAALDVMLPNSIAFIGQTPGQRVLEQMIGDINPQDTKREDFRLIVTSGPESIQHVNAKLTYNTDLAAKTQFESDGAADLIVGESAVNVSFTKPANIFSGQDFDVVVNYANNTSADLQNLTFTTQYPPAFTFKKSSVPVSGNGNIWNIGTLPANATGTFTITGNIVGPEQALYTLTGMMTADFNGQTYPVNIQTTDFAINASPLSISITLNGKSDYIAGLSDGLTYTLNYKNNSAVTFRSATIKASLVGSMFDVASIHADGPFDSRTNTITWSTANAPDLLAIAPGQTGSVTFTVTTKPSFPIRLPSDKNYMLKVNGQIQSPTVPPDTAGTNTVSITALQSKMGGIQNFSSKGYYKDAASGILNSGPYPPKVDAATTYTIHWRASSVSTDATNVTFSAYLQSGTTFTGKMKSTASTSPVYDPGTGLVTWTIPVVPATTGVITPPQEAIFQVSKTPAINEANTSATLVGPTTVKGTDAFTGAPINATLPAITTDLPDDPAFANTTNHKITQ